MRISCVTSQWLFSHTSQSRLSLGTALCSALLFVSGPFGCASGDDAQEIDGASNSNTDKGSKSGDEDSDEESGPSDKDSENGDDEDSKGKDSGDNDDEGESPDGDQDGSGKDGADKDGDDKDPDSKDDKPEKDELPEPKTEFEDSKLEACVKKAAGSLDGKDLAKLEYLDCHAMGITKLGGMSQLKGLKHLTLFENQIKDIGPLGRLTSLETLQLGSNHIESIQALENLTKLKTLSLVVNQIEDLSPLKSLAVLEELNLDANKVKEVSALSALSKLKWLTLDNNQIADKSALKGLKDKIELVYADIQGKGGWSFEPTELEALTRSFAPVPKGELRLRDEGEQGLDFDFVTQEGLRIETAKEWWGALSREGGRLVLSQGKRRVVVGEMHGERPMLCEGAFEERCQFMVGIKMPNTPEGGEPSVSVNFELTPEPTALKDRFMVSDPFQKHESLLPYVFSSPNQYDAGSCAYMAATGTMEILLNQKDKITKLDYNSKNNLAEPFLMNLGGSKIPYFFTDSVYHFNNAKAALPDKFMPFSLNRSSSAKKNWDAVIPKDWRSNAIEVPRIERTVLFYDPPRSSSSKWEVGLMDQAIVERIKYALRSTDAPVLVVYNHNGYWHVSIIVGYDDTQEHGECPMVKAGMKALKKQGKSGHISRIEAHMKKLGGCSKKGVFLARDSIYPGSSSDEPYTYGGAKSNGRYSRRIVKREYEWIHYLSNHVTSVYRAERAGGESL